MSTAYDIDFDRWAREQAAALKAGDFQKLDLENLAEEIESLSRSDRRAIESFLARILFHLLKWRYQPERRSGSWQNSVEDSRAVIRQILKDSPSLRSYTKDILEDAYRQARRKNPQNPAVDPKQFPATCPWTLEQVLDDEFWPKA
jgi:hypothetical protein